MKLSVERKPASLVVLDITADDDEFAQAMNKAVRKVSRDVQIPGFRKGKAPRSIIERYYGREVFLREAADEVMDTLYRQAIEQEDLRPVGEPSVEINDLEPVNFVVTVPVFPTVDLGDYADVRVEPVDASVTDEDVDEVIERLRRARGTWVDVTEERTPVEGDQVTVDYEVTLDGEPFQDPVTDAVFVLGETNLLTQLREKLEEMKAGESSSFDLNFDEDDETVDPTIRGKSLSYNLTVKSIRSRELPELDDEFAQAVNEAATVEELRQQIRDDVHMGKTNESRTGVVNDIINQMASKAEIDPPSVMVDDEIEHQLNHLKEDLQRSNTPWEGYLRIQNKTEDEVKEELRPEAERRLRNSLFLQEVAKQENVEITDDEIEAEITRLSGPAAAGDDPSAIDQAARMAQFYRSDYFQQMLRNELFERKLYDRLIEVATEGQGAVLNGYVAPDPVEIAADDAIVEVEGSVVDTDAAEGAADAAATEPEDEGYANAVRGDGTNTVPDGYRVKGNADSMIYHTEESGSYERTVAEWYFASAEDAEAAGFRAPANMQGAATADAATNLAEAAAEAAAKKADAE